MIDLRSDTVTKPTAEMRRAMAEAEVGDDGLGDDPTVIRLEAVAAARLGKEAAVFVPSGTMANLVAALAQCKDSKRMIVGDLSHMNRNESRTLSLMGIDVCSVRNSIDGGLNDGELDGLLRHHSGQRPPGLLCLENTHARCIGAVLDPASVRLLADRAHGVGAALHLDGARIFNAAVALGVPVIELARHADTVSFCISKGLACPIGSLVCGTEAVIREVRKARRMLGGDMRQAGIVAAAGLVALDTMIDRLAEDHAAARRLALGLAQIPGLVIEPARVRTNIVMFDVVEIPAIEFVEAIKRLGVLVSYPGGSTVRMVTHYGVGEADVDEALARAGHALRP